MDRGLAARLLGWPEEPAPAPDLERNSFTVEEAHAVADVLEADNIGFVLRAPVFVNRRQGKGGVNFYGDGLIKSRSDLEAMELPDPTDSRLYEEAHRFVACKGERAAAFVTRVGIFPTLMSMGLETFSIALHEDRGLVEAVLDRYCEWSMAVAERACGMGFDLYVSTDDMAFKTGPLFSPDVFRELVLPRYRRVAELISLPWVLHSDGDIGSLLPDIAGLGVAGIHPVEKGAMDIRAVKRQWGDRLCVLGNVDLNLLAEGSPDAVDREVRALIEDLGGPGYILSSGNSLPGYLKPENVRAMTAALRRYGALTPGGPLGATPRGSGPGSGPSPASARGGSGRGRGSR